MTISEFELMVLNFVCDDYEAVHTIRDEIARDAGRAVSDDEIAAALVNLTNAGLIDVFILDQKSARKTKVDAAPIQDLWFLANNSGLSRLENFGRHGT
jgi:hypothetical protein